MIRLRSRVALKDAAEFTGTVERDEDGLFTVAFDVGGRGWLREADLIEINTRRDRIMHVGSKVALRDFPEATGVVKSIDPEQGMAHIIEDGTGIGRDADLASLIEVNDIELPDDKSWPPRGMETKTGA